jgi:dihydrodipicolinate synthase/N-acetylneuraminate lyase
VGGINALANVLGDEVCRVFELFAKSELQEAVELHLRLVTPNAVVRGCSPFRSFALSVTRK